MWLGQICTRCDAEQAMRVQSGIELVVIFAKEVRTIHRQVPWGNGLYNPHHEDRLVGPTELTWICRLNIEV